MNALGIGQIHQRRDRRRPDQRQLIRGHAEAVRGGPRDRSGRDDRRDRRAAGGRGVALREGEHVEAGRSAMSPVSTAPKGRRMGHAGAIISAFGDTAAEKAEIMRTAGLVVAPSPAELGTTVAVGTGQEAFHAQDGSAVSGRPTVVVTRSSPTGGGGARRRDSTPGSIRDDRPLGPARVAGCAQERRRACSAR